MATKTTPSAKVTESVTLSPSNEKKVATILSELDATKGKMGYTLCAVVTKGLKGCMPEKGTISKESLERIVDTIASKRGWSDDTKKSRKTEIKVILTAHRSLMPVVTAFTTANKGDCRWDSVVGLARKIVSGDYKTADAMVKAQIKGKTGAAIKDSAGAKKWTARKLQSVHNAECMKFMPKGFAKALTAFAAGYGIVV